MAHKYSAALLHPLEDAVYCSTETVAPLFQTLGVTPNQLTAASFGFSVLSAIALAKRQYGAAALAYLGAYLFDCWDGGYARMTDQCSPFGDYFDHFSDWAGFALLLFGFARSGIVGELTATEKFTLASLLVFLLAALAVHCGNEVALQEHAADAQDSLQFLKRFAFGDPNESIQLTRWLGYTGVHMFVLGSMLYLALRKA